MNLPQKIQERKFKKENSRKENSKKKLKKKIKAPKPKTPKKKMAKSPKNNPRTGAWIALTFAVIICVCIGLVLGLGKSTSPGATGTYPTYVLAGPPTAAAFASGMALKPFTDTTAPNTVWWAYKGTNGSVGLVPSAGRWLLVAFGAGSCTVLANSGPAVSAASPGGPLGQVGPLGPTGQQQPPTSPVWAIGLGLAPLPMLLSIAPSVAPSPQPLPSPCSPPGQTSPVVPLRRAQDPGAPQAPPALQGPAQPVPAPAPVSCAGVAGGACPWDMECLSPGTLQAACIVRGSLASTATEPLEPVVQPAPAPISCAGVASGACAWNMECYAPGSPHAACIVRGSLGSSVPSLPVPPVPPVQSHQTSPTAMPTAMPTSLPGLVQWLDASDTAGLFQDPSGAPAAPVTSTGQPVGYWRDKSGAGNHTRPPGASPTYSASLIGTKPAIDFSNSSRMISAAFAKSADVTLFWVGTVTSGISRWGTLWGHFTNHDNDVQLRNTAGSADINWHTNNDNSICQLPSSANPVLYYATMAAGTEMFLSMTSLGKTTEKSASMRRSWTPGDAPIYVAGSEIDENFNGYIGEIIYYQRVLTPPEIASVVSYLRPKWGI